MKIISMKKEFEEISSEELAKLILSNPGTSYTVSTHKDGRNELIWPRYSIVSLKLFDEQTVFIDRCDLDSAPTYNFKLPTYDECSFLEKLSSSQGVYDNDHVDIMEDMLNGLSVFNKEFGETKDIWYIKPGFERIEIIFKKNS